MDVALHTYVPKNLAAEVEALANTSGFALVSSRSSQTISFDYLHCMSSPTVSPPPVRIELQATLQVQADVVLRFGFMEGDVRVVGERVVYDPQSHSNPRPFLENGSSASHLVIVANEVEIRGLGGTAEWQESARTVLRESKAEAVVVKRGSLGAWLVTQRGESAVPAYAMDRVFTIGSGDIFSAAFTQFWGVQGLEPQDAADLASRATALYCHSRSHPLVDASALRNNVRKVITPLPPEHRVYLAGPFFNLPQRWLIEEVRNQLIAQGLQVFSPLHDVGFGGTPDEIASRDLKALKGCDRVFAILDGADPGTVFEVGYARSKGIPVVVFAQQLDGESLTMIQGTGCEIVRDFTTAIYRTAWVGRVQ